MRRADKSECQSASIVTGAMSKFVRLSRQRTLSASLLDERLRVSDFSPGKIDHGGVGQHPKPMAIEIRRVGEQPATLYGGEKPLHNLGWRQAVAVEYLPADARQGLACGTPRVSVPRPTGGWFDEKRVAGD